MASTYCTYPDLVSSPPKKASLKIIGSLKLQSLGLKYAFLGQLPLKSVQFIFSILELTRGKVAEARVTAIATSLSNNRNPGFQMNTHYNMLHVVNPGSDGFM